MKFKEGNKVEVCHSDGGILQSWFRARIISCNADCYRVEYDNLLNDHGKRYVEDVRADAVRPEPPHMTETRKLAPGHIIEAYDNHSWKVGRVLKALPGRLFVVKLMESLQKRTFHQSVIRARLFWENEGWLHNVEDGRDHLLKMGFRVHKKSHFGNQCLDLNAKTNAGYNEHEQVEAKYYPNKILTKNLKRKAGSQVQCAHRGDVFAASQKRSAANNFRHQEVLAQSTLPVLEKVDPFSSHKKFVGEEFVCTSPNEARINRLAEEAEDIQCSVDSSSSSNELDYVLHSDTKNSKQYFNESHFDDAQSSSECPNIRQNDPENKVECKIHKLEIHAYRSAMRAFYASGCLTWGRETLLTNLRLELHISDEEHSSELTRLCSTKALKLWHVMFSK